MPRGTWRCVIGAVAMMLCAIPRPESADAAPPDQSLGSGPMAPTQPYGAVQPAPLFPVTAGPGATGPAMLPPTSPPSTTGPGMLPSLAGDAGPAIRDLTPPGFATEPLNPTGQGGEHEVPGHLNPAAPSGGGLFTSAEFLEYRARRGLFDFAIPGVATGLATTGPIDSLNYRDQPGFRAALGYRFGNSGWDITGEYTYFHTNADQSVTAGPGEVLFPTLTRPGLVDQVSSALATGNLSYNTYDLTLGRRFAVDDHLAVRMYGGFRYASILQDFQTYYDGIDANQAAVSARSTFQGFGPIIGTEGILAGWRGFHVYARASGGLLGGMSNNPIQETNNGGQTVYVNSAYDVREVIPVLGVGFGVGWQYRTVSIRVGYEFTQYYGLIQQPRFVNDVSQGRLVTTPGNLSLEGLFVQFGVAF